jgi:hypothetical protein
VKWEGVEPEGQRWVGTSCDHDGDRHLILYYLITLFVSDCAGKLW